MASFGHHRRDFLKATTAAVAGGLVASAASPAADPAPGKPAVAKTPAPADTLPKGKIRDLAVSRLLLGGNLLTHFTHSRDLRYVYALARQYNTEEKILQTMAVAEAHGIDTLVIHTAPNVMNFLKKYRNQRGGKIQWIICPTAETDDGLVQYSQQVQQLVDDGVEAIYLWGVRADALTKAGKIDVIGKAVELVRAQGIPSGVGAHTLATIVACEKAKVPADFYIKTLHHHNYPTAPKPGQAADDYNEFPGYWCGNPTEVVEFMKKVEKPWIAFKVMAAGAIPPEDAFRFVLQSGADFVLAGMFDFEIGEDSRIAREILAKLPERARPWRA